MTSVDLGSFPILMYHRIAPCPAGTTVPGHYVHPARFARHMEWLRRLGWTGVSTGSLAEGNARDKEVGLTFDDGYRNFVTEAVPAMVRHGHTGTVFLVTSELGGINRWDHDKGDVKEALMSEEDVAEAMKNGMEPGSHTCSHVKLDDVDVATARGEIFDSRARLERLIGGRVVSFCYPYGGMSQAVRNLVEEAGYGCACSTMKGWNRPATDRMQWRRINVRKDTSTPILFWKIEMARRTRQSGR